MHCLVSKVSTKYNNTMCIQHIMIYMALKGGNMSPCKQFQIEFGCCLTK